LLLKERERAASNKTKHIIWDPAVYGPTKMASSFYGVEGSNIEVPKVSLQAMEAISVSMESYEIRSSIVTVFYV